ncbi:MAG: alpha/beta fold hydrolase [Pseudomonas sp.]|nr:alpha/beta fold hydrolase [Pseudomonas sp.]
MSFQEKTVRTGSFDTFYLEAGSGQPLVLIHGGGPGADSYGNWRGCLPILAEQFHVYAYDMVGFGRSDAPDPQGFEYSMDARARQLIDFIDALGLSGVNVIGNSMGGATVLGAAMQRPDLIGNMVLMGSAGLTRELSPVIGKLMHYDFTLDGMRQIATALAYPGYQVSEDMLKYRYELTLQENTRRGTAATQSWVKSNGGLFYEEECIAAVKTRTLVFHGKNDQVVPLGHAYRFLELLENSHGYILPKCGHWAMMEHPEVFSRVCIEFFRGD